MQSSCQPCPERASAPACHLFLGATRDGVWNGLDVVNCRSLTAISEAGGMYSSVLIHIVSSEKRNPVDTDTERFLNRREYDKLRNLSVTTGCGLIVSCANDET